MEEMLVDRIRSFSQTGNPSRQDIEVGLAQALEAFGAPMSVQDARNGFSGVLRKVRDGTVQLVGRRGGEMAVVMSVKELAAFLQAATRPLTYGDVLDAMGYRPVNRPAVLRKGRPRQKLVRYRPTEQAGSA